MLSVQARKRSAFTLMEVLIVIGILALLLGILIPTVSGARASARVVQCTNNLQQINTSFRAWGVRNSMRLPDTGMWITAVKSSANDSRILYCPDGPLPNGAAQGFDKFMITHNKAYTPGNGHPDPIWTPDPTTNPNANSYVVEIKYQNARNAWAKFVITRISGNSWRAFAERVDSGGGWGGPPVNMNAGSQVWTNITQGQTINFLFGESGTNYGYNTAMANLQAPKGGKVLAMDYAKMSIDYSGDADDDLATTYLKVGRHAKNTKVNALLTDGSVQLLALKEINPSTTLVFKNK